MQASKANQNGLQSGYWTNSSESGTLHLVLLGYWHGYREYRAWHIWQRRLASTNNIYLTADWRVSQYIATSTARSTAIACVKKEGRRPIMRLSS